MGTQITEKSKMPNDREILELLYRFALDPVLRRKILVENPAKRFGF
jgi:hypothetical protein